MPSSMRPLTVVPPLTDNPKAAEPTASPCLATPAPEGLNLCAPPPWFVGTLPLGGAFRSYGHSPGRFWRTSHTMSESFIAASRSRAVDEGLPALPACFARRAALMRPLTRALICDNLPPAEVDATEVLVELDLDDGPHAWASHRCRGVWQVPDALSAAQCAALRDATALAELSERCDTVDSQPEYQLDLSSDSLAALVGGGTLGALHELARRAHASMILPELAVARAALPEHEYPPLSAPHEIFVRRYAQLMWTLNPFTSNTPLAPLVAFVATCCVLGAPSGRLPPADASHELRRYTAGSRPWFPFHFDQSTITINVALTADCEHTGGALLALERGEVTRYARTEGTATVHSSALLHAVTRLYTGVRYALVIFFGRICPVARHALVECTASTLRTIYDDKYGGYHCDSCGAHSSCDTGEQCMYHCAEGCEYDLCADCYDDYCVGCELHPHPTSDG